VAFERGVAEGRNVKVRKEAARQCAMLHHPRLEPFSNKELVMRSANVVLTLAVVFAAACSKEPTTTTTTTNMATGTPPVEQPVASTSATATTDAPMDETANEDEAADQLRTHHRHHHHGGVAMFVHMAIDTLGVAPEKKAQLDKIQSDLDSAMAPAREANKVVLSVLADGVAAGKMDKPKVDAAVAKEQTVAMAVHAASTDALNRLYAVLSPAERQVLVDKVEAHAAVWKKVNADEVAGNHDKGTHLAKLTALLGLSTDQVDKMSTALAKDAPKPDTTAMAAHLTAFEKAFVADSFDAKTLTTANAGNGAMTKHGAARMVRFYSIVTPQLTPDQRTKLAAHLRERLNDHQNAQVGSK
jgi:hypothetical protein